MSGGAPLDVTSDFFVEDAAPAGGPSQADQAREADAHRLAQRQKQIDIGKNTLGYQRFTQAVPRHRRDRKAHPMTPDVYQVCSKRAFDGQVKKWRRMLHEWDLPEGEQQLQLPVTEDTGGRSTGRSANPPAPASEPSDDFEHVTHADARSPPAPKNGRGALAARPGGSQLPLKMSAVAARKRAFDDTLPAAGSSENLAPGRQQQQQWDERRPHGSHPAAASGRQTPDRLLPSAKHQRSDEGPRRMRAAVAVQAAGPAGGQGSKGQGRAAAAAPAPAREPSWAEQRYQEPELDYGTSDDEGEPMAVEGGWQYLRGAEAAGKLPGSYQQMTYNNPAAPEWDEEDIQL